MLIEGKLDSTKSDGLTFIDNSSFKIFNIFCGGNKNTISWEISPCDPVETKRYYVVVDGHALSKPNSQVEVEIKHEGVDYIPVNYDFYANAAEINNGHPIDSGLHIGDTASFPCGTTTPNDQQDCGATTLWWTFETNDRTGPLYLNYNIIGQGVQYNSRDIILLRELIAGDSTETGLERLDLTTVTAQGQSWGKLDCMTPGRYYIMATGCNYALEQIQPRIWYDEAPGNTCDKPVVLNVPNLGTYSATQTITCNSIGSDFGESGNNMGCLFGPNGYKSTWFKVAVPTGTPPDTIIDLSYRLIENTTAFSSDIRYRVLYGTCGAMTAGPCNNVSDTEFELTCMQDASDYFIQVVTPESAVGDITLEVTASSNTVSGCIPFNPTVPVASFTWDNACNTQQVCFNNTSTAGDSITYDWDFGVAASSTDTSSQMNPCFTFPDINAPTTYNVELTVTNLEVDTFSTASYPVTVYPLPNSTMTRSPSSYIIPGGTTVDFNSNVSNTISSPATLYDWDIIGSGVSSSDSAFSHTFGITESGARVIRLQIFNGECLVEQYDTLVIGSEPIFAGGANDGFDADMDSAKGCEPEAIFAGGIHDGFADDAEWSNSCPDQQIFAGGINDGFDAAIELAAGCEPQAIYAGGINDGFDAASDQITITPNPAQSDLQLCPGQSITLTVTNTGSSYTLTSYYWSTGQTSASITVSPQNSTTYSVLAYSTCGVKEAHISIEVIQIPEADAGPDRGLCASNLDSLRIGNNIHDPDFIYSWTPTSGLSHPDSASTLALPSATTDYILTISHSSGCPVSRDTVTFTMSPDPVLTTSGDALFCTGDSTQITVSGTDTLRIYPPSCTNLDSLAHCTPLVEEVGGAASEYVQTPGKYYITGISSVCEETYLDSVTITEEGAGVVLAYRSQWDGNWTDPAIWEVSDDGGMTWVGATSYGSCPPGAPYPTSRSLSIEVQHQVIYDQTLSVGIDQTTLEAGAQLTVPAGVDLRIVDSSSSSFPADFQNKGRLEIAGTLTAVGAGLLVNDFNSTVAYTNGNQALWDGAYGRLEVDGGGIKTLSGASTRVNNEVEFINGHIQHNSYSLRLGSSATTLNASNANGWFVTNNYGSLIKEGLNGLFRFPVGPSSAAYNPLDLQNAGTSDQYTVRVEGQFDFNAAFNDELDSLTAVNRTWYVNEQIPGGSQLDLTFFWASAHENSGFDVSNSLVGEYIGGSGWQKRSVEATPNGSNPLLNRTLSGLTKPGIFAIGSCSAADYHYRSISDGNWSDVSIWEVSTDSVNWENAAFISNACGALSFPNSGDLSIQVRHEVDYDSTIATGVDQLHIDTVAQLNVLAGKIFHVLDGPGKDMQNAGYLKVTGELTWAATAQMHHSYDSWVEYDGDNQLIFDGVYGGLILDGGLPNAGAKKSLNGNGLEVARMLQFSNAKLDLGTYNMLMHHSASTSGAGATQGYIMADHTGRCSWAFEQGKNVSHTYPIGGDYYSPATVVFDSVRTAGQLAGRVTENMHPTLTHAIHRYWTLDNSSVDFEGDYSATFTYVDIDLPYIPATLSEEQTMIAIAGAYSMAYTTPNNWRLSPTEVSKIDNLLVNQATIINDAFSDFTFMEDVQPLPIQLLPLRAQWKGQDAELAWATLREKQNKGFWIERSEEGQFFQTLDFVEGLGESKELAHYTYLDKTVEFAEGKDFFYRLRQEDFNGNEVYSNVEYLQRQAESNQESSMQIRPNVVDKGKRFEVLLKNSKAVPYRLEVFDVTGKALRSIQLKGSSSNADWSTEVSTQGWAAGTYVLRLSGQGFQESARVIVTE